MGKKFRLNRFITKWIKSDLPEDRSSSVLLLGVTRIPTSPVPPRRPCSLPLPTNSVHEPSVTPSTPRRVRRLTSSRKSSFASKKRTQESSLRNTVVSQSNNVNEETIKSERSSRSVTPTNTPSVPLTSNLYLQKNSDDSFERGDNVAVAIMERSMDSIGSCSLDLDASVDSPPGWSERSSTGTLLSASILSNTAPETPHLPSYLSLACTVNGYSTITNYDPVRLSKSRDASPHRTETENLANNQNRTYGICGTRNNLLSPPNLVPLPSEIEMSGKMTSQSTIESYCTKETNFSDQFLKKDNAKSDLDSFYNNFESIKIEKKEQIETKSFIQQRVERLYGPGALAQGFFINTKRRSQYSESEIENFNYRNGYNKENHSKSMSDDLLEDKINNDVASINGSNVTPFLPVLRHLRPEFRAQLPIVGGTKKNGCNQNLSLQTTTTMTVPKILVEEKQSNGCDNQMKNVDETDRAFHGKDIEIIQKSADVDLVVNNRKDGHYFMKILDNEANRLLKLADECEKQIETIPDLSEDVVGKIRSASGKARLLVSQKMQQFKGLCTNNIKQVEGEAFPTTNEDLEGFWDMVMLQVNQVDALFDELEKMKKNNWKEVETVRNVKTTNGNSAKSKKIVRNPVKTSPNSEECRRQREAREIERKKLLEERRKAMRNKVNNSDREHIEIFVPESTTS